MLVAQAFLNGTKIIASFEQVGRAGAPECVGGSSFVYSRFLSRAPDSLLHCAEMEMLAPDHTHFWIGGPLSSRKDPLPNPFLARMEIFFTQGKG